MGRLQGQGVRAFPDRAWMARLDVVHGRQGAQRRPHPPETGAGVGTQGAPSDFDMEPLGLQALQHSQGQNLAVDAGSQGPTVGNGLYRRMFPWSLLYISRVQSRYRPLSLSALRPCTSVELRPWTCEILTKRK